MRLRLPRLAREWALHTRFLGTSSRPYYLEENLRRDADQWGRYLIYRRWVIYGPWKLTEVKGDWSED